MKSGNNLGDGIGSGGRGKERKRKVKKTKKKRENQDIIAAKSQVTSFSYRYSKIVPLVEH